MHFRGCFWDQNGSFRNWWTPSAKRAFDDRAQCVMDEASMCYRVNSDVHAIGEMRVDRSLRQLQAFHTDYQCKAQDQMVNEEACIVYGKK